MTPIVRDIQVNVHRTLRAAGDPLDRPHRHGSIAAVVENPFAGRYASAAEIGDWMTAIEPLAREMAIELRDTLAIEGYQVEGYGKGGIVGANGELEVVAAWHGPAGIGLRSALDHPLAQVPSSKKVGAVGAQVDIPLVYLHASYLRSHYDVEPVMVADGPRSDEVVYAVVMSCGPRPAHRIGGFGIDEVDGSDGLR